MEAHHYCSHLSGDMRQCVIYDTDQPNAKLIGIEYIVTEKIYQGLPEVSRRISRTLSIVVLTGLRFACECSMGGLR